MIALCLGGSSLVWSDLERAKALIGDAPHIIVACNFAGVQYPGRLDAWCTLHPERIDQWREQRAAAGMNTDYRMFTNQSGYPAEKVMHKWRGSSGLYMAQVAVEVLGADQAVLCGVPMDDTGGHIHWRGDWRHAHHYRAAFEAAKDAGLPIRSMSGWTAGLFGTFGDAMTETSDMAWVIFTEDFDYCPTDFMTIAYKASPQAQSVREECAAKAVLLGKATRWKTPSRPEKKAVVEAPAEVTDETASLV